MKRHHRIGWRVKRATLASLAFGSLVLLSGAHANEESKRATTVDLDFSKVTVEKNEDGVAVFSGAEVVGEPGSPGLPSVVTRILLPPDADLRTARVKIEQEKQYVLPTQWDVIPRAALAPVGGQPVWPKDARIYRGMNLNVYEKNAYLPDAFIGLVKGQPFGKWRVLLVRMYPYRYNPVTKQLQRLEVCTLRVTYDRDPSARQLRKDLSARGARRRAQIKKNVVNFATAVGEYEQQNN